MKCGCEARMGERPTAASIRPTGPSWGIGYGVGVIAQNPKLPSGRLSRWPRAAVRRSSYCTS
jgi:hypothetical protein